LVKQFTPITNAHSIADLQPYRFGAQTGTTGLDYIKDTIKPAKVQQYDDTNTAGQALSNGQIDAVVIDVPIAIPMTKQFKNLEVIGQFITNEGYAMTLEKGNPLQACVNSSLDALKQDGTLKTLTDKYFPNEKEAANLPVFE
jgi:polar amino acid transport system substrate-binding protein